MVDDSTPSKKIAFSVIHIKISANFFAEIDRLILKFTWKLSIRKFKGPRIAKTVLERKNKVGRLTHLLSKLMIKQ